MGEDPTRSPIWANKFVYMATNNPMILYMATNNPRFHDW